MSTLSDWFRGEEWSRTIKDKLKNSNTSVAKSRMERLNAVRGERLTELYKQAEDEARETFEKLKYHPLFVAGLMLYAANGDKTTKHHIKISSTNPKGIVLFKLFLSKICEIQDEDLHASLLLYKNLLEERSMNYWLVEGDLHKVKFNKTLYIKDKSPIKHMHQGVCNLGISSSYLKRKMLLWLQLIEKELVSSEYYAGIV